MDDKMQRNTTANPRASDNLPRPGKKDDAELSDETLNKVTAGVGYSSSKSGIKSVI